MAARDEVLRKLREVAREALAPVYSDPYQYDLLAQMTAPADVPFYLTLLVKHGDPVLEIGSGTGRIMLELARAGADVIGVELSEHLLEAARQKAAAENLDVTLALGDMRSFDLDRTFPLILMPYNALNCLLDDDSVDRCLETLHRHMDEGSRLVIDTLHPSPTFLADEPERRRPILRYLDPLLQKEVVLSEENHWDPETRVNRILWSYAVDGVEDARVEEMPMRLFFPDDLEACLERAGLRIEEKLGDYDGRAFDSTSSKQLVICRRS